VIVGRAHDPELERIALHRVERPPEAMGRFPRGRAEGSFFGPMFTAFLGGDRLELAICVVVPLGRAVITLASRPCAGTPSAAT